MKEYNIKILILNYNGKKLLKTCLDSVESIEYSNYTTILIVNHSNDGSVEYVKSQYPNIEVIQTGKNLMYAGGYNYFFNMNPNDDCYYMILNNDAIVDKNILNGFIQGVSQYGEANIYGPKIMLAEQKNKIWYAGSKVELNKGIIKHLNIREDENNVDLKDSITDYISGCCLFVHSKIVKRLKGFDENFNMYMEDVDFCLRAKHQGIQSYFLASPLAFHYVSASVKRKPFKIINSYIKLSIKHTGIYSIFNVPLFILRKILFS